MAGTTTLYIVHVPYGKELPEIATTQARETASSYALTGDNHAFGFAKRIGLADGDKSAEAAWLRYIFFHKKKESELLSAANRHGTLWRQAEMLAKKETNSKSVGE